MILVLGAAIFGAVPARSGAGPVPVVLAVDTSRSLQPEDLRPVVARLRLALEGLPPDTPLGLLAFDDEPRWVVPLGSRAGEVGRALTELVPQGRNTLLHDALFVTSRAFDEGGVIILASDGRDESSATLVEDIARLSEARHVRILAIGSGDPIEELALRRLTMLTGGRYLGAVGGTDASALANAIEEARQGVLEDRETARPRAAGRRDPIAEPIVEMIGEEIHSQVASGRPAPGPTRTTLLVAGLAGGLLLAGGMLWQRRRSTAGRPRFCRRCGSEQAIGDERCEECYEVEIQRSLGERNAAPETRGVAASLPGNGVDPAALDRTRVLSDLPVLQVKAGGSTPRTYLLEASQAFGVGREQHGNTLALPDPALSAHHFKIVPDGSTYFLVDMGSTNGSFVNGRRIRACQLQAGDAIRAGAVEFEFQRQLTSLS